MNYDRIQARSTTKLGTKVCKKLKKQLGNKTFNKIQENNEYECKNCNQELVKSTQEKQQGTE